MVGIVGMPALSSGQKAVAAGLQDQVSESFGLCLNHLPSQIRDLEIPTPGVPILSLRGVGVGGESFGAQVSYAPIEVPWIDRGEVLLSGFDLLNDGITVRGFPPEDHEYAELQGVQGEKTNGVRSGSRHCCLCSFSRAGEDTVKKVQLSFDHGRHWESAHIKDNPVKYAWESWNLEWTPNAAGYHEIWVRSWDQNGITQPPIQPWNPKGYLGNVIHRVPVQVKG